MMNEQEARERGKAIGENFAKTLMGEKPLFGAQPIKTCFRLLLYVIMAAVVYVWLTPGNEDMHKAIFKKQEQSREAYNEENRRMPVDSCPPERLFCPPMKKDVLRAIDSDVKNDSVTFVQAVRGKDGALCGAITYTNQRGITRFRRYVAPGMGVYFDGDSLFGMYYRENCE